MMIGALLHEDDDHAAAPAVVEDAKRRSPTNPTNIASLTHHQLYLTDLLAIISSMSSCSWGR